MAKGDIAKQNVVNKIKECFGEDYIDYVDKKLYVWADEGGEKIQIALSMTCPKNWIAANTTPEPTEKETGDWDWSTSGPTTAEPRQKAEITDDEKQRIQDLMKKFNLI